jgi:Secretion system C-terminal sorting domain/Carboxypeptidase regulatory-like domain
MKLLYSILLLTILVFGLVVAQRNPQQTKTDKVTFISQPPTTGIVGITYKYTAKAVSSDSTAKIWYTPYQPMLSIFSPSYKYTVDSATGLLVFTPRVKGWYSLGVMARSTKGGSASQIFFITVTGGNGIVLGHVTYNGSGIKGVVIELYETELTTSTGSLISSILGALSVFQGDGCFSFCTVTDASGGYRITGIDPGSYKIHATSPSPLYDSQWYDGKTTADSATVIHIVDSSQGITRADISLLGKQSNVSVSGSVKDTLGVPIKKADVIFVNSNFALNANDSIDDFRDYFDINAGKIDCKLDGGSQQVIHIIDSSNGTFNAKIPPGSYIAFAKADGYITEFYQEQSSLLLATTIVVKQNTPVTNINFTLAPVLLGGSISGGVIDSSKRVGVPSRIVVSNASKPSRAYIVDTDSLGVYSVTNLPQGTYFLLALPLGKYSPAYYTTDTVSIHWKKATPVSVGSTGINIYVHQFMVSASGYAGVGGTVRSSGKTPTAIPGAFVYAIKNNQVAGYSITNTTGAFSINGLAPGSYSVTVDNLGSTESPASTVLLLYNNIIYNYSPVTATIDFSLSSTTGVETTVSMQPEKFELSQNYPNPFNPTTTINYAIKQPGIVVLKVYNIVGQEIQTLVNGYQSAGRYQVTLNADYLSSGVYFYRLQSSGNTSMRKMVLLR